MRSHLTLILVPVILMILSCEDMEVRPIERGTLTDHEGNEYETVRIGEQWWMAENLKVTTFLNGDQIPNVESDDNWAQSSSPAWCLYQNNSGVPLYNHYVVTDNRGIAPVGWRVPTDEDWMELEEYIGMSVDELDKTNWRGTNEGQKLKRGTTIDGELPWVRFEDLLGTDEFGFNSTPNSCRVFDGRWGIPTLKASAFYWSSSVRNDYAFYRYLDYKKTGIFRYASERAYGMNVRLVRDN